MDIEGAVGWGDWIRLALQLAALFFAFRAGRKYERLVREMNGRGVKVSGLMVQDQEGRWWEIRDPSDSFGDVLCPHKRPVDLLRARYDRLLLSDLERWVAEHADEYTENVCQYGH